MKLLSASLVITGVTCFAAAGGVAAVAGIGAKAVGTLMVGGFALLPSGLGTWILENSSSSSPNISQIPSRPSSSENLAAINLDLHQPLMGASPTPQGSSQQTQTATNSDSTGLSMSLLRVLRVFPMLLQQMSQHHV